ncbi:hypothetical protein CEXT_267881 [Caerostris extrusa]|uniref:Uncharacterized protein n=1 Tax=Caerostris extrusa TaxID=172846 RepID=A0AAV4TMX1_CAEEX|nr:hypothetical protein CEXT_267881 [Caerostris extrusa]
MKIFLSRIHFFKEELCQTSFAGVSNSDVPFFDPWMTPSHIRSTLEFENRERNAMEGRNKHEISNPRVRYLLCACFFFLIPSLFEISIRTPVWYRLGLYVVTISHSGNAICLATVLSKKCLKLILNKSIENAWFS